MSLRTYYRSLTLERVQLRLIIDYCVDTRYHINCIYLEGFRNEWADIRISLQNLKWELVLIISLIQQNMSELVVTSNFWVGNPDISQKYTKEAW